MGLAFLFGVVVLAGIELMLVVSVFASLRHRSTLSYWLVVVSFAIAGIFVARFTSWPGQRGEYALMANMLEVTFSFATLFFFFAAIGTMFAAIRGKSAIDRAGSGASWGLLLAFTWRLGGVFS